MGQQPPRREPGGRHPVEFQNGDALLVIGILADFEHDDAESLLASFRERGAGMATTIKAARSARVPVIYVNDDRDRWDGDAPALAREAANGPGGDALRPLLPQPGDPSSSSTVTPLSTTPRWSFSWHLSVSNVSCSLERRRKDVWCRPRSTLASTD
jgi:hypothetical protein